MKEPTTGQIVNELVGLMPQVVLEGYNPAFENRIYLGDTLGKFLNGDFPLKSVVSLSRYKEPTEDEVVGYLQALARSNSGLIISEGTLKNAKSPLEVLISKLPPKVISDLSRGDKNCLDFVRARTSAPNPKDGVSNEYVVLRYGILPPKVIEANMGEIVQVGAPWYDMALYSDELTENGLGIKTKLKLFYKDGFIPREHMDILLNYGAESKTSIEVARDIEEVPKLVHMLYGGIKTRGHFNLLEDKTQPALEEKAYESASALMELVMAQRQSQETIPGEHNGHKFRN